MITLIKLAMLQLHVALRASKNISDVALLELQVAVNDFYICAFVEIQLRFSGSCLPLHSMACEIHRREIDNQHTPAIRLARGSL